MLVPILILLSSGLPQQSALPVDPCTPAGRLTLGEVDRAASILESSMRPLRPFDRRWDSSPVMIRLRFVVGCDGSAEPDSFGLIEASDSAYSLVAVAMVQATRFRPALVDGKPVRQLVERRVIWETVAGVARVRVEEHNSTGIHQRAVRSTLPGEVEVVPQDRVVIAIS
jgi:hypothetical protein